MRRSKHYNVLFNVNLLLINKLLAGRGKKSNQVSRTHIPSAIATTLSPVLFIKIGLDSSKTLVLAFKPISWLWKTTPLPSILLSTQYLQQQLSQQHKIKTFRALLNSIYGHLRLVVHYWSLSPPPSVNHGPLLTWKAVWWARVTWRMWRPGRGSRAGDSGSEGRWGVTWSTPQ